MQQAYMYMQCSLGWNHGSFFLWSDSMHEPSFWKYAVFVPKSAQGAREVNKNNLLGEQFFAQKSGKIINWVGSLQFLSAPTQIMRFPPESLRYITLSVPSSANTQCRISWTEVLRCVDKLRYWQISGQHRGIACSWGARACQVGFLLWGSSILLKLRSNFLIFNNCGAHFSVGKIIYWVGKCPPS